VCEQEGSGPCVFCNNMVRMVSGWHSTSLTCSRMCGCFKVLSQHVGGRTEGCWAEPHISTDELEHVGSNNNMFNQFYVNCYSFLCLLD